MTFCDATVEIGVSFRTHGIMETQTDAQIDVTVEIVVYISASKKFIG